MSIGMILLIVLSSLILMGALQRVLDRMALTDRQALLFAAAIFIGGWLPDLDFGLVRLNIGGAIVPLIICIYLLLHAGTQKERIRAVFATLLTAAAITVVSMVFPADPVNMPWLDPMILYGVAGGVIAWLMGRSRRSAFIAGVLGVLFADLVSAASLWLRGVDQAVSLGGAGALDAVVLSGVIAVLCCELAGEAMERMHRGKQQSAEGGSPA